MMLSNMSEANLRTALRDSKTATRPYVILNPLLAKHLAVSPSEALSYFEPLAEKVAAACQGERVLVIGFAETATAVAAAVAVYINAACYVHTTREERDSGWLFAEFLEEHSHAKNQSLYLQEEFRELSQYDRIVFVEDEITTGKTILNFLRNINAAGVVYNGKFGVAALVFNNFDESVFADYPADFFCLQKINAEDLLAKENYKTQVEQMAQNKYTEENERTEEIEDLKEDEQITRGIFITIPDPRIGVRPQDYQRDCLFFAGRVIAEIRRQEKLSVIDTVLVLGTEEFMYPALILGRELEREAKSVKTHSTTRSPLRPTDAENYPMRTRAEFASPYDSARKTYLYNLSAYDLVILLTDAQTDGVTTGDVEAVLREIRRAGSREILFMRVAYNDKKCD